MSPGGFVRSLDPALWLEWGEFAIHHGVTYKSAGGNRNLGTRRLLFDDAATYDAFPDEDVVLRVPHRPGSRHWMLDVPDKSLDRVYHRTVVATWFGEAVQVSVPLDVATGTVRISYERHPAFAAATHMGGSQYSTWTTHVDASELEDIQMVDKPVRLLESP